MLRIEYEQRNQRLTITALAARAGLNRPLVSSILRGRVVPRDDELVRLAAVLGVKPPAALLMPIRPLDVENDQVVTA